MTLSSIFLRVSIVALCYLGLSACKRSESPVAAKPTAASSAAPAATSAAPAPAPAGDWNKLRGRWLRPDGGYVLEIRSIADDGRAEANYFNPDPIHVAWAKVANTNGVLKFDAELRDVNYPGCLYKLTYAPDRDQLFGTYFQAQMQETHQIVFVREP
jgi:hypothetical protein